MQHDVALLTPSVGDLIDGIACRLDTAAGQLPEAFEMDERSYAAASDEVLQLVSGRQLLGGVRIRRDVPLPLYSPGSQPLPSNLKSSLPLAKEPGQLMSQPHEHGQMDRYRTVGVSGSASEEGVESSANERAPKYDSLYRQPETYDGAFGDGEKVSPRARSGSRSLRAAKATRNDWSLGPTLELLVGDEVTAVALQRPRRNGLPLMEVYSASGDLVAREANGYIQLVGRGGGSQHSIVRGTTPLVRHLQFMFQPMGEHEHFPH